MSKISKLTSFLDRLDEGDLHYTLSSVREGTVTVAVSTPGERWEVEFMDDGDVEVEIFRSDGEVSGFSTVEQLFKS